MKPHVWRLADPSESIWIHKSTTNYWICEFCGATVLRSKNLGPPAITDKYEWVDKDCDVEVVKQVINT